MKTILKTIPVWALLLVCLPAAGHNLKVWLSSPTLTADGSTVTYLTIYQTDFDGTQHTLYTDFQMQLNVPEGVTLAQKKSGRTMVNDVTLNADRFDGLTSMSLGSNQASATCIKFALAGTSSDTYYADDVDGKTVEELFTIGLLADPNMKNGSYDISLTDVKFVLSDGGANIPSEAIEATLTVTGGQGSDGDVLFVMSEVGYATLILPFDAELPEGLHAYTCTDVDAQNAITFVEQDAIAANVPLVVAGPAGSYNFSGTSTATETSYTVGVLTGVYEATEITSGYVLQMQDELAFYRVDEESPMTVPANRCFLSVSGQANALSMHGVTGIMNLGEESEAVVYDLQGRCVQGDIAPGVYVKQGIKFVKK